MNHRRDNNSTVTVMADQLWNKGEEEDEEGAPFYYPFLHQNGNPLNSPTIKLKVLRISLVSLSLGCEAGATYYTGEPEPLSRDSEYFTSTFCRESVLLPFHLVSMCDPYQPSLCGESLCCGPFLQIVSWGWLCSWGSLLQQLKFVTL